MVEWLFDASAADGFILRRFFMDTPDILSASERIPGRSSSDPIYHPVTAVFVRNGGKSGIVPMHPLEPKENSSRIWARRFFR